MSHDGPIIKIPVGTFPREDLQFIRTCLSDELGEGVLTLWLRRSPSNAMGQKMSDYLAGRLPRRTLRFGLIGVEERYVE